MRFKSRHLLLSLLCLTIVSGPALAQEALTPEQKSAVETLIGNYLREHPEVVVEGLENFRARQEQEMQAKAQENINKHMAFLTAADAPSVGNPNAKITVVEFFDYNCGYCKKALPDIVDLVEKDKDLRVVFHEMPILSDTSHEAAKWAIAAHKQGKYFDYHSALMESPGQKNEASLEKIAKDLGLDVAKMKADANAPETSALIEQSTSIAREVGIQGTPAFIVNGTLYPGYLGPDGLKASVDKAREDDKKGG